MKNKPQVILQTYSNYQKESQRHVFHPHPRTQGHHCRVTRTPTASSGHSQGLETKIPEPSALQIYPRNRRALSRDPEPRFFIHQTPTHTSHLLEFFSKNASTLRSTAAKSTGSTIVGCGHCKQPTFKEKHIAMLPSNNNAQTPLPIQHTRFPFLSQAAISMEQTPSTEKGQRKGIIILAIRLQFKHGKMGLRRRIPSNSPGYRVENIQTF